MQHPTDLPQVPLDPELAAALGIVVHDLPRISSVDDAVAARAKVAARPVVPKSALERGGTYLVWEDAVPAGNGELEVEVLVCQPIDADLPTPCFVYIHGGGMITGDNRTGMQDMLEAAHLIGAAVVSVEYRRAPETRYPGAVEDCYRALVWTAEHACDLGIDVERLILAGTSAGGGLAAATALLSRDRRGPRALGQMLLEPMLDDRNTSVSSRQEIGRGVWDRAANQVGWTALLGELAGGPEVSAYAAPGRATDLSELPAAFIDVGSAEVFRDEAVAYATGIWRCGGEAELHV